MKLRCSLKHAKPEPALRDISIRTSMKIIIIVSLIDVSYKHRSRRRTAVLVPLLIWGFMMVVTFSWLGEETSRVLLPPPPPDQNLDHFRRSRDLEHYLDNIQLLIEPSTVCEEEIPLVILVSSAPSHMERRQAIRRTWGKHQPTYFVIGLGERVDETLADNYVEAKQFSDLIVYDFPDHYQNLTLKTMLMLQWALDRCSTAEYFLKTDDDVLINPWTLKTVLEEHNGAKLIGYRFIESKLHRDEYTKWFVPRWLHSSDYIPQYLSGSSYLINANYIQKILTAAKNVPLINLEDVYLTYLVCKSRLNFDLVHDRRLSLYKPWVPSSCAYWTLASSHRYSPDELVHAWAKIEAVAKKYEEDSGVCGLFKKYVESEMLLS